MGRFHLELFYLSFHHRPIHKLCFLSCRPFVVNARCSTSLGQETEETTRPVKNVALTTKGLQERKQLVSGTTVEK